MARPTSMTSRGQCVQKRLVLEALEPRVLLSGSVFDGDGDVDAGPPMGPVGGIAYPSAHDQYMLELVNRARNDPVAEAALLGLANLNEGVPGADTISPAAKQPLAFNLSLIDAARKHTQWMLDTDTFSHFETDPPYVSPVDRMREAGYDLPTSGGWGMGENITRYQKTPNPPGMTLATTKNHEKLFVDDGYPDRAHRVNICNPAYREIGVGTLLGIYSSGGTDWQAVVVTEDFAYSPYVGASRFLTGVAYDDDAVNDNDFYTPGEGLVVVVTATRQGDGQVFNTTTWDSGGYSLLLAPGTYDVVATSPILGQVEYDDVVIGTQNVKRDFTPDQSVIDNDAPTVVSVTPTVTSPFAAGTSTHLGPLTTLDVVYSEGMAPATIVGANIELLRSGGDNAFGNGNDVTIIPNSVVLDADGFTSHIHLPAGLPADRYRLTLDGTASVTDLAGNRLDGEFSNTFPSGDGVVGGDFVGYFAIADAPPTLTLDGPAAPLTVDIGDNVPMAWTDADPDDNATISLAFDPDKGPTPWADADHTWLTQVLTEDADGTGDTFTWDTTGVPPGAYSVWGVIDDGTNPPVYSRAAGIVTVEVPVNDPPTLALDAPAAPLIVSVGDNVPIAWTDADPEENAAISLAFDPDSTATPWDDADHTWLSQALTEDPDGVGDTFTWDTTGVAPGTYSVWGVIDDGVNPPVYTRAAGAVHVQVPSGMPEASILSPNGQVRVVLYDTVPTGIPDMASRVRVKFGKNNVVTSITLTGDQPMSGLGILVTGATRVGRIADVRNGVIGELAFIASDARIGPIALKLGIEGFDLNGRNLAGMAFPADVDGDGDTTDRTGLYLPAGAGAVKLKGELSCDVVAGSLVSLTTGDVGPGVNVVIGAPAKPKATTALTFGEVTDLSVNSATPLRLVKATRWLDGKGDNGITAPRIVNLNITGKRGFPKLGIARIPGDFQASLTLAGQAGFARALGRATINGSVSNAVWVINGNAGPTRFSDQGSDWEEIVHGNAVRIVADYFTNVTITVDGILGKLQGIAYNGGSVDVEQLNVLKMLGTKFDDTDASGFNAPLTVGAGGIGTTRITHGDYAGVTSDGNVGKTTVIGGDIVGSIVSNLGRVREVYLKAVAFFDKQASDGWLVGGNFLGVQLYGLGPALRPIGTITVIGGNFGADTDYVDVDGLTRLRDLKVTRLRYKDQIVNGKPVYAWQGGGIWADLGPLGVVTQPPV